MSYKQFDLTPDPNVLIALTHTPLKQLDALCELVDNALDSFSAASRQGIIIESPCVQITLPKSSDIKNGLGVVQIKDNGPGLTAEAAEYALRAGYSSNNQYDNLGLFGMGFNISTGKLGSVTTVITAREEQIKALRVVIDLNEMNRLKSYKVLPQEIEKPFQHGTLIEVSNWWPEGNSNYGFIKTLARYSITQITDELGRRYASILREGKVKIIVNGMECTPYEFCVWGANRHVLRKKYGEIPAVYSLNHVIFTQRKCFKCGTMLESFQHECPACGGAEIRTVEERIRGWVGIQRYDSATEYGIDLVRNGRAICIAEKTAFFEFTDEFNKTVRDYPIDGPYGRIVGEIHLDHVPVDFLKRDFQRSTAEWQRAMSFIRGDSSLQPTQRGADKNTSPLFKLYQGYRKVRTAGTTDMYMGYWDSVSNAPHRISREIEDDYIRRFKNHEPGYYDDAKWWEKVEEADHAPIPDLPTCPGCGLQLLDSDEVCSICGHIVKGKSCKECKKEIPLSAKSCPHCGTSQVAEILKPWKCSICGKQNAQHANVCSNCGLEKGKVNTLSFDFLKEHSNKVDSLSIDNCTISLPDGFVCPTIHVNVYDTSIRIQPNISRDNVPIYVCKNEIGTLEIFIDRGHKLFTSYKAIPELMIASEIAERIKLINGAGHDVEGIESVSMIVWQIVSKYWNDTLEKNPSNTQTDITSVFQRIKERLVATVGTDAADYFAELTEAQSTVMAKNIINAGVDISTIGDMRNDGRYLLYVGSDFILKLFDIAPQLFFDGKVWTDKYETVSAPIDIKNLSQQQIKTQYRICLSDLVDYDKMYVSDALLLQRINCSIEYLRRNLISDVY